MRSECILMQENTLEVFQFEAWKPGQSQEKRNQYSNFFIQIAQLVDNYCFMKTLETYNRRLLH